MYFVRDRSSQPSLASPASPAAPFPHCARSFLSSCSCAPACSHRAFLLLSLGRSRAIASALWQARSCHFGPFSVLCFGRPLLLSAVVIGAPSPYFPCGHIFVPSLARTLFLHHPPAPSSVTCYLSFLPASPPPRLLLLFTLLRLLFFFLPAIFFAAFCFCITSTQHSRGVVKPAARLLAH